MEVEKGLDNVGEFGLYQKLLCLILISYTTFICGVTYYTQILIFATPGHNCGKNNTNEENNDEDNNDCEDGWEYDTNILFPTITSEVHNNVVSRESICC